MRSMVFLSTYPFKKPRHGGQIRASKLVDIYKRKGWEVTTIAIYEPEGCVGDEVGDLDIPFPPQSKYRQYRGRNIPLINDLLSGAFSVAEDGAFKQITTHLPDKIDLIHIEQAWLWPLAEKIKEEKKFSNVKIVYGSQNIEYELKKKILSQYQVNDVECVLADIQDLEKYATLKADFVAAVTEEDAKKLLDWGASKVIIAQNGIEPWNAEPDKLKYWKERLPDKPWMLYIASAHPPNFTGFNECIGDSLACIPPDSKLVIVGSVCEHIYKEIIKSKWSNINGSRLQLLYLLDDDDLAAVKSLAHCYFLPIVDGGGSNLKTAEAIYSGSYVLGTQSSFRGFEKFTSDQRINIFSTPQEFHRMARIILASDLVESNDTELSTIHDLTWSCTLDELVNTVNASFEGN